MMEINIDELRLNHLTSINALYYDIGISATLIIYYSLQAGYSGNSIL